MNLVREGTFNITFWLGLRVGKVFIVKHVLHN